MVLFLLIKMLKSLKAFEMMEQTCAVTEHGLTSSSPAQEVRENFPREGVARAVLSCWNYSSIAGIWVCGCCFVECIRVKVALC